MTDPHPCWLPPTAPAPDRVVLVAEEDAVAATLRTECAQDRGGGSRLWLVQLHRLGEATDLPAGAAERVREMVRSDPPGEEGFTVAEDGQDLVVAAQTTVGLLYGWHAARRALATGAPLGSGTHSPAFALRVLNHWDNLSPHPVMGHVERGYAGRSLFFEDGTVRPDLARVEQYARLLASVGINRVAPNNVNVHPDAVRLMTELLPDLARIAEVFRRYGIRLLLSVNFAAPILLGDLRSADPKDLDVRRWWREATDRIVDAIPDFGGYLVKADSEGQPGPHSYGRDHADGANMLAEAVSGHGAHVFWRAFVYNHRQDWRDRSTDRARAAYDHFTPLDGRFRPEVVLQVKHGPMDFQVREPVSPLLAAVPRTRLGVELQVTQEYTGQQKHVCYLATPWQEVLATRLAGPGQPSVAETVARTEAGHGALVGVSNVGTDPFWTGHPLAQANLYALGRLAWRPSLTPEEIATQWSAQTFPDAEPEVRAEVVSLLTGSWRTYEKYTAPLGVGWMVRPGHHYGPDVDGYEYTPWGTYHFADRDGVGVDRTSATGTGFTAQYPPATRDRYEDLTRCPDELLLFFHHVPYGHVLHRGTTVIQHIYDNHFEGVEEVDGMREHWAALERRLDPSLHARVAERLEEQRRSAGEWRDQVNTYFWRKSGVPDERGRRIW